MHSWWLIALRGALGILFGLVALLLPGPTILSLVLLFSAYMLVDGLFSRRSHFAFATDCNLLHRPDTDVTST